jgi:hypothetical protein
VDNGIVHTVNALLSSSNETVPDLLAKDDRVKIFSEALTLTGLADYMSNHIKDETWNYYDEKYEPLHGKVIYSGAQNDWCDIPEERKYKFTVFACSDSVLSHQDGITDIQGLYTYAKGIYGGPEYSENLDFTDPQNPLLRLVGYHCLPFAQSYDRYTTICTIKYNETKAFVNPTEWYATMDTLTTLKVTRMKSPGEIRQYGGVEDELYLNRSDNNRSTVHWPGVHVNRPSNEYVQSGRNGAYFLIDGLVDYSEETKQEIFNTRIRFDLIDCFPEMLSNDLRNYDMAHDGTPSDKPNAPARNFILPNGYLDGVKTNEDGYFAIDLPLQPGKVIIDEVKVVCSFSLEDATYAYNKVSKKWELTDADFFGEVAKQNLAAGSSYYYALEVAAVAYTSSPDLEQPK